MRFVEIPAGSFDMGSKVGPGEAPVHRVTVPGFWMGVTEVTQAQWQAVMGSNPSHFKQAGPNAPVEMVSWNDVQAFISKLNAIERDRRYRLPSEAEWEYACRGGSAKDPYGPPTEIGWIKENSGGTTHPVGQKRPNGFGLYDMQGNVSEWTQDTYHPDYNGAPADGRAWTTAGVQQHTLRGGGWDLPAFFIHSALRGPYDPIHRLGFRLVCVPVAQANGYRTARPSTSVVAEIPFALLRNKTIVPVAAGGASLRLILDTGMGRDGIMLFRGDGVDTAGFGRASQVHLDGAGGGSPAQALLFDSATFSVGTLVFDNQPATIVAGDLFKGFPTDGTIGHSLFGHYVVELDYDRNVMTLHDTATFAVKPGWESLPIYFKSNRIPWIDVVVATGDEPPVRLSTYIDNASSEALELLTRDANRFRVPSNTRERYLGRGLSGDIYGQEGRIARLRIGSHELTDVLVAIAPAAVRSRQEDADAVLANNALRRFNVIFDYAHSKLHLRPNSHFAEPF